MEKMDVGRRCFLGRLGAEAWGRCRAAGRTEMRQAEWRHAEQERATGYRSLKEMPEEMFVTMREHYRAVIAWVDTGADS